MKLYSLKTLKNGEFRNVDINQIKSIPVCTAITLAVMVIEVLLIRFLTLLYTIDIITAMFALFACITVTIFCSVYILWYFIACETYIEK